MIKVSCAIIIENGKILITQNDSNSSHPFQWEFPGGKIKQNETAEECVVREIREELEIDISVSKSLSSVEYDYGFKKIKLIPFLCFFRKGKIKLNEHKDCKWVKLNELKLFDFSGADLALIQLQKNWEILEEYPGE